MKWRSQKHRQIISDGSLENLRAMGLPVVDAVEQFTPEFKVPDLP